ncbi:malignant fibrous histiocytoma-amplified sequence 1 homolog [Watersipora subatra]|uniref:malignant fibrous histiocytoma-amplified sequence 1 homolog n=1 Tax=Watersipora subatra TaxID=2589382 RepID=UPI00355C0AB6
MCDISSTELTASTEGSKPYRVSIWDFSGDPFYLNTIHHFLDSKALYLLTFNLSTYRTGDFEKTFATWLNYVIALNNQVKLLVVGTHADLLSLATIRRIGSEVDSLIKRHFSSFQENIQEKIRTIESMENIGSYMQDQLKHHVNTLQSFNTFIYSKHLAVSSANYIGVDALAAAITELASDVALFPMGLRQIPSLWVGVHDTLETLAKNMRIPIMQIDEFQSELIIRHGMRTMMPEICTYLHDTGAVVWLLNDEKLKQYVFLRPRWLIDVIKTLVRDDLRCLEYEEMEDILISRAVLKYR